MLYFSQHVPLYDVIQQRLKPRCCVEISAPGAKARVLYFLFTTSETRPGNPRKWNKRRYAYIDFDEGGNTLRKSSSYDEVEIDQNSAKTISDVTSAFDDQFVS